MGVLVKIICLLPLLFTPSFGTFFPFFNPFLPLFGGRGEASAGGEASVRGDANFAIGDQTGDDDNNNVMKKGDAGGQLGGNAGGDAGAQAGGIAGGDAGAQAGGIAKEKPGLLKWNGRDFDIYKFKGTWELHSEDAGLSAMHLVLLPNTNKAVMFDAAVLGPSKVAQPKGHCRYEPKTKTWDCWAHGVVYDLETAKIRPLTVQTDTWCSSGGLMVDGTLLQTGGYEDGGRAMRFLAPCDTCDWREYKVALTGQRWYGTQQTLADGAFVIVGGRRMFNYEFLPREGQANKKNINLPFLRETTDMYENNLYPFVLLAPDSNLYILANNRSIILNPYTGAIVREFPVIPDGARNYPASGMGAFLPIQLEPGMQATEARVEVLVCGGAKSYADELAERKKTFLPALKSCGRMEITAQDPFWLMEDMPSRRVMGDMLLLPNADVLMINGAEIGVSGWGLADKPNFSPLLYLPTRRAGPARFRTLAPSNIPRMYHSSSAVLTDGKVLVAGSNTNDKYALAGVKYPTELRVEKFSPPYLDESYANFRPEIDIEAAVKAVTYGERFRIPFRMIKGGVGKGDLKVTFYSPPFTTHGFSQNQRLLVLGQTDLVKQGGKSYSVEVEAPPSGALAPPGFYMLFVVYRGIPSVGMWIQIK